ncbi:MAG: peptide chain release factor-like protein [Candidatus Omnitrophica bacterium]|nr:peptide chain release factor-like protein [Candidatus Omnitrophota bacterium]
MLLPEAIFLNVSPQKEQELLSRMSGLGVKEEDLKESFVRASGPGGQKVNKTSTCVMLKHIPTGLSVKCQKERSQALNRFIARRRLLDKIEEMQKGFVTEEKKRIEKIRRQKRRRSRRAKEKMLEVKHRQSQKKQQRKPVDISVEGD